MLCGCCGAFLETEGRRGAKRGLKIKCHYKVSEHRLLLIEDHHSPAR